MSPKKNHFKEVIKRDGRVIPFEQEKISAAVKKAMMAAQEGNPEVDSERVSDQVVNALAHKHESIHVPTIEQIQDMVETQLMAMGFTQTAKSYILYRNERTKIREQKAEVPEHVRDLAAQSKKYFKNPLGEFIYYRTYSRWIEEENRRETWIETVDRYMGFMEENLGDKLTAEEYKEVREGILNQEAMPSMRLLQFAGRATKSTNVCAYNCSFIAPSRIQDFAEIVYISMCGTGVGFSVENQNVQQLPQIKKQTGEKLPAHLIADSKEGWADALTLGLKTWFDGKDIEFDYSALRPAGARLKTMGGKSSGPDPLRSLLSFTRTKILKKQGRRLSNLDVHDIICKIGEIVVAGGVRRSALISLSDLDDTEMRDAKKGQFYLSEPQRSLANNSAVYTQKPTAEEFMEEWIALMKSGSGERGIFNRGGLAKTLPERRLKVLKGYIGELGTNPCVTNDTWVMTENGPNQVKNLIDAPFQAIINGEAHSSFGFFKTGEKDVFEVKTTRGFKFKATNNHKVLTVEYKTRKVQRNVWKEVQDLIPGDKIILHNHQELEWSGKGSKDEGWLLGNLLGDGNIEKSGKVNLDYWGENQVSMMEHAANLVHATVNGRSDLAGHIAKTGYARVGSVNLGKLAASYNLTHSHKLITETIEETSSDFHQGFLAGWFDADGSVQGNQLKGVSVRLSSNSLPNLESAERMLARLGIISSIYKNRRQGELRSLPDGRGDYKSYWCEANHELIITGKNISVFRERIGFRDNLKQSQLNILLNKYARNLNQESFSAEVSEVAFIGKKEVYDCQVPNINAFDGNGIYLHNCGEIILQSRQFCNLSEVVCRAEDTENSLLRKIRLATILGTYQATLTNLPYLSKEWTENCEKERLLGVSMTGQWDSSTAREPKVLSKLKEEAIRVNQEYAKRFKINESTCITCVKPSGNLSQTVDCSSGLHPRHSEYYIRRVRIAHTDALFKMLRDQKIPYHPEVGQSPESATTYVVDFPVKSPKDAVLKDNLTALELLEHWKIVKINFTEHNPSVTVSIGDNEWIAVANWVYNNWDWIGGLSFLPRSNHVYQLAPYEEINEEQFNELSDKFAGLDFSQIMAYEKRDETDIKKELACAGGVCEIDDIHATEKSPVPA